MPLSSDSKILIIRLSSIGDIVVCSPIIRCIKKQIGCEVHFLVKKKFKEVQMSNPYIEKQFTYEDEDLKSKLRHEKYDLVIDLHKNLRTLEIKSWLRAKWINYNKRNIDKWLLVNFKINRLPQNHLVDRYFEAIRELGVDNDGEGLDYFIDKDVSINYQLPEAFVALVVGAAHFTKQIPSKLCESYIQQVSEEVVLLGGKGEIEKASYIASSTDCINLVGQLTLDESAIVISKAAAVITGDTGLMHMAAALKKPIVSVWGSTSPKFGMFPYFGKVPKDVRRVNSNLSCQPCTKIGNAKCPKGHFDCMSGLSAKDLISQTNEILLRN